MEKMGIMRSDMENSIVLFRESLLLKEIKEITIRKYERDIGKFLEYAVNSEVIGKDTVIQYKEFLKARYSPSSVNSYLVSLNRYLKWLDKPELAVRLERIQKRSSLNQVLELSDYHKLLSYVQKNGKWKYYCIMKTLAGTGIRVGELRYITCEALEERLAVISHKGKIREICIPDSLCELLRDYCRSKGIQSGIIFYGTDREKPMDVTGIWKGLKRIAAAAGVAPERVYPHSFRHLFAKTYMKEIGNIAELSDILGHSNIETTRIYTMETIAEKRACLERLSL